MALEKNERSLGHNFSHLQTKIKTENGMYGALLFVSFVFVSIFSWRCGIFCLFAPSVFALFVDGIYGVFFCFPIFFFLFSPPKDINFIFLEAPFCRLMLFSMVEISSVRRWDSKICFSYFFLKKKPSCFKRIAIRWERIGWASKK